MKATNENLAQYLKTRGNAGSLNSRIKLAGLPFQVYVLISISMLYFVSRDLAFPYLAMYLAGEKVSGGLQLEPSLVGIILMVRSLMYIITLLATGSLCDRFGRRRMILLFTVLQTALTLCFAYVASFLEFLLLNAAIGGTRSLYDTGYGAMVADLVQPDGREHVFGLIYMISNIGTILAPPIGGAIAGAVGYSILFQYASMLMGISVIISFVLIRESQPKGENHRGSTSSGYYTIIKDRFFVLFCAISALTMMVYIQFYGLLSVYIEDIGLPPYAFGFLVSANGIMALTLQIPVRMVSVKIGSVRAFILAELFIASGFSFFIVSRDFLQFLVGVILVTLGEITLIPASSGFIANIAPVDMRGRYTAFSRGIWSIGGAMGNMVGFRLYDVLTNKEMVWATLGAIGFATLPCYVYLLRIQKRQ